MKLMANWDTKDDHGLMELISTPGQNDSELQIAMLFYLTQNAPNLNVSVYDTDSTNVLEWALANGYFTTLKEMLDALVEHAKENKNDIGLVTGMIHEALKLAHTCDLTDQEFLLTATQNKLTAAYEASTAEEFRPGCD